MNGKIAAITALVPSRNFRGPCLSNMNCARVCVEEGRTGGAMTMMAVAVAELGAGERNQGSQCLRSKSCQH
nr:unnamed protein product [Digitaria exilis]